MDPSVLLAQISGDAIQSIEVITVPTCPDSDAQGKGGIIWISTPRRQGVEGFSAFREISFIAANPGGTLPHPMLNSGRTITGMAEA